MRVSGRGGAGFSRASGASGGRLSWPTPGTREHRVLRAMLEDGLNTSADIADVLDMSMHLASAYVCGLAKRGLIRRAGREIPLEGKARALVVYEPAPAALAAAERKCGSPGLQRGARA